MAKRKVKTSFDLLSSFTFYVPGIGGMFIILALFILGALLGEGVVFLLRPVFRPLDPNTAISLSALVSYPFMFVPPMIYASFQSRMNQYMYKGYLLDNNNFGEIKGGSIALAMSVVTIATAFVTDIFGAILPPMPESLQRAMEALMDGPLWITLLSVSVFAPVFEEWLCRGIILRGLLQKMRPVWAIVISAAFFAFIHLNPWQAIPAFIFGLLFGYVYYRTGSLKLTMLMHCVNNTFAAIIGRIDMFKGCNSFMDLMSTYAYVCLVALCVLYVVYRIVMMLNRIYIPYGQKSGCKEVSFEDFVPADSLEGNPE